MPDVFFIELSREIEGASHYELEVLSETGHFSITRSGERFAVVSGETDSLTKTAFVNRISLILKSGPDPSVVSDVKLGEGRFHVRFMDNDECHDALIEPEIGNALDGKGRIDFKNPDFIIRVYHWGEWYICREIYQKSQKELQSRRAPLRPFFSPVSIHPKFARFFVNISGTRPGDTILDPFCGTGGILIEAGLMGRNVTGNDWSLQMATGAKLNLKYFGLRGFNIYNEDFINMNFTEKFHAIITDMPYGKNAPLSQKDLSDLYSRSFKKFHSLLHEGGRCVVVLSDINYLNDITSMFDIRKIIRYRVHKSLTRYFAVLQKIG